MDSRNKQQSASIRKLSADEIATIIGGVAGTGMRISSSSSGTGGILAVDGGTGQTDDHGSGTGIA